MAPAILKHRGFVNGQVASPISSVESVRALSDSSSTLDVRRLNSIAASGLMKMFDPQVGLFCQRMTRTAHGIIPEGISPQYTIITLLGLHQLEVVGVQSPVSISKTFETLLSDTRWVKNVGDIGLLLWLSSLACPEHLEKIVSEFNVRGALERESSSTIELAMFLAGLSHHAMAETGRLSNLTDPAVRTFQVLKQNQGEQGIFGHCARTRSISGVLRGRIGSFADQSYSIYALAKTAQAFSIESAATTALDCALTMCQLQGPLGQWWWHYDAVTGRVVGRYPIFSVHQAGTAPMALMELGKSIQSDFSPWIQKGMQWICGENELDQDMRDTLSNVIWGYICSDLYKRYVRTMFSLFTRREDKSSLDSLSVRYECRPYHVGWYLYAYGRHGLG